MTTDAARDDPTPVVFLHGAGRAGAAGWPLHAPESRPGWVFLDRTPEGDDPERDAARIVDVLEERRAGHVVASSYGACAGVIAAQQRPDLVTSLALCEPACFDLARGQPAATLVVTGGWSPLYDQTAEALVALGAAAVELPGAGHGVHRDPRILALLDDLWAGRWQDHGAPESPGGAGTPRSAGA